MSRACNMLRTKEQHGRATLLPTTGPRAPGSAASRPARPPTRQGVSMPELNTGDTAWVLASSALVLLMTPGLAFFYGGMVRSKNVLNMLMMSFIAMSLVTVIWVVIGYSLAFAKGTPFIGGTAW